MIVRSASPADNVELDLSTSVVASSRTRNNILIKVCSTSLRASSKFFRGKWLAVWQEGVSDIYRDTLAGRACA